MITVITEYKVDGVIYSRILEGDTIMDIKDFLVVGEKIVGLVFHSIDNYGNKVDHNIALMN